MLFSNGCSHIVTCSHGAHNDRLSFERVCVTCRQHVTIVLQSHVWDASTQFTSLTLIRALHWSSTQILTDPHDVRASVHETEQWIKSAELCDESRSVDSPVHRWPTSATWSMHQSSEDGVLWLSTRRYIGYTSSCQFPLGRSAVIVLVPPPIVVVYLKQQLSVNPFAFLMAQFQLTV